ncbi:putative tRNA pseudouridine synthase B [uncultured archaeon]|nr:putative tRNA pseudouridine synthase B [uncultured archaeon]
MKPPAHPSIEELLDASFLILDKPRGPSTHEVTAYIRKLLGVKKVGQMGTLDPQASGVLVIGIGKAVRLLRFVDMREKVYVGVLRTRQAPQNIDGLQAVFNRCLGQITQTPPKQSAVAKRPRQRKVYEFRALELVSNTALFTARVEAGTYIRVLCTEVGKAFGEGKMIELRRTSVGSFSESRCRRLPDLTDAAWEWKEHGDATALQQMLVPAQELLTLPCLRIAGEAAEALGRGSPLAISDVAGAEALEKGEWVQIAGEQGRLLAMAQVEGGKLRPRVVLGAK